MDDSLQIIIYIVFLAIYFLSRFLKGNKKKATPAPPREREQDREVVEETTEDAEQPMTFEDILRELTQPKERRPVQKPKPAPTPEKREYEFKTDYPDENEIQEVYEDSQRKAREVKTLDETVDLGGESIKFREYQDIKEENTLAADIKSMLKNPEDARKAIILKEILDRKF